MTGLLLDTHALLWSLSEESRLSTRARAALSAGGTPVFVSAASIWEIAIKQAAGKLTVDDELMREIGIARFAALNITFEHAKRAGALPAHHGDPFDRMLVAQAQSEGLTIITRDARIAAYDVPVLW